MSIGEVACSYAVLMLHDDGIDVTAEKISSILKASNVTVESYWPSLFAKLCEKKNVGDLIMNVGGAGGGGAVFDAAVASVAGGAALAAAAPATEEKKKEEADEEESDGEITFSLFDD